MLRYTLVAKITGATFVFVFLLLFLAPPLTTGAGPRSQPPGVQSAGAKPHAFVPTSVPLPERSEEPSPTF